MRISCIQMNVLENQPEKNLARAEALLCEAAATVHPHVAVLPETWNLGFSPGAASGYRGDWGQEEAMKRMSGLAARLDMNIVAGSLVCRREGKLYNTAPVYDRRGQCVAMYDKTHLFSPSGEDKAFEKGSSLARFTLDGVSCAVVICYDLRFPELIRTLALPGLDVLFAVSQWPAARAAQLQVLTQARAIENQMFVALCNACASASGVSCQGGSRIVGPLGAVLAQAGREEAILTADAELGALRDIRRGIPVFSDRRPELYRTE